jgi:hypothetical protein
VCVCARGRLNAVALGCLKFGHTVLTTQNICTSEIKVNNYQTKSFLSYNISYLRYVSQDAQTAMPEDISAVNSRSIYIRMFSNLIFLMSSVSLWFLRVLWYSSTCTPNVDVVQQKRQKTS